MKIKGIIEITEKLSGDFDMSVLKVALPRQNDILISARASNQLLDCGDGAAALLYIYIMSHGGELDVADAAARLRVSHDDVLSALAVLEREGLVGSSEAPAPPERSSKIPEYTQTDVAEHIGSDESFKYLVAFCEERLGKMLSSVDLQVLLGIYSWLGLPVDVICLLVTNCIEEMRKKHGFGRVPTMRTIEKQAKIWVRDGVVTCGRAEEYLKEAEKKSALRARIASILNIEGRALAPTEERYISEWAQLGIADELIAAAYDRTVVNTGGMKWRYADKILRTWHENGFSTIEDVARADEKRYNEASGGAQSEDELENVLRLRELNRKKGILK